MLKINETRTQRKRREAISRAVDHSKFCDYHKTPLNSWGICGLCYEAVRKLAKESV